ncbi:MAG TPA: archaeosine biosynthesis radical SAM protein RaSEA [Thermoplasmata archaeon]|nr:archaeosine biosynthesis radical SAM protein RaSEA [Thermoplasmata archaeon]
MNASVARSVAVDRRPPPAPPGSARHLVRCWTEAEALGTERVRAFVIILKTRGCYWADVKGCSMCGYSRDTLGRSATELELRSQIEQARSSYRGEPYVKVYTSGSFLDDREVDPASRVALLSAFSGRARRFLFETLPEFVVPDALDPLITAFPGEIEVAMGLESADPVVLRRFVNKGSPPEDYFQAAGRAAALGVRTKAYLLLKPPYLSERESVTDVVRSIARASPHYDSLSVNPVHIQGGTVVEWLYHRRRYRPPWLWSLVDALRAGAPLRGAARLVTFPTAGGKPRGPHNCGKCDPVVLAGLEEASLGQNFDALAELTCGCRARYDRLAALEPLGMGS